METGLDGDSLRKLQEKLETYTRDPVRLKLLITGVLLVGGLFGICRPLADQIADAREELAKIEEKSKIAKDAKFLTKQQLIYQGRIWPVSVVGNWQEYVISQVDQSGAKLRRLLPRKVSRRKGFDIIELDLIADGETAELLELVQLLERGERLTRITNFSLERGRDSALVLTCVVAGLADGKPQSRKKKRSSEKKSKSLAPERARPSGGGRESLGGAKRNDSETTASKSGTKPI